MNCFHHLCSPLPKPIGRACLIQEEKPCHKLLLLNCLWVQQDGVGTKGHKDASCLVQIVMATAQRNSKGALTECTALQT